MKFRFSLTHRGSENTPFAVPALDQWQTQTGAGEEWSLGPMPSVTLPGVTFGGDESEYLYVDYAFEAGIVYTITASYTKTYLSGTNNPRVIELLILDSSFVTLFSESDTTPTSPGGVGSVTLSFTATVDCDKIAVKVTDGSEVTFVIDEVSGTSVDPADTTVSTYINEPDGWKDAVLKLGRDKDFRSLIEFFEGSFIFYGSNGVIDGGIHFIKNLELIYGPDVSIEMLIELTLDDYEYETVFLGQLDLSLAEELMDNKFRIPIIRDNFWAKFMNRRDTPVDLFSSTDLDQRAITDIVDNIQLKLPGQPINYYGEYNWLYSKTYDTSADPAVIYFTLNWDEEIRDDIKLFSIGRSHVDEETASLLGNFEAPYDGTFNLDIGVTVSQYDDSLGNWNQSGKNAGFDTFPALLIYKSGADSPVIIYTSGDATLIDDGTNTALRFEVTPSINLFRGEQLSIVISWIGTQVLSPFDPMRVTVFGNNELNWKTDVDLVSQGTTLTLSGEQTIDGILTSSSRILVKDQGDRADNGIYVTGAGAWTRATDLDDPTEFFDAAVYVLSGDAGTGSAWLQTEEVGVVGVDENIWTITDPSDERYFPFPDIYPNDNHIIIHAATVFRETQQPAMLIHDAAAAILKSYGLGEDNPFYSEVMGSALTNARQYDQDGCIWNHAILRGLQLRGYTLTQKPFFLSFNEWWKGVNPIFNLGLTYETIEGSTTDPTESAIQDLIDWDDAGGPFPGVSWNYAAFGRPFTSVNGDGGVEGYTCGTMATVGGQTYVISTVTEIFATGVNTPDVTLIFALLDSGFNELDTIEFTYSSDGFKVETFFLTPPTDGTYFALRVINNTVSDTKSLVLRMAVGDTTEQLLLNEEFSDGTIWTNEGAGTDWTIGGDEASISLASGSSKALTQEFTGGAVGEYYFISEYTAAGAGGGDTADLTVNFYDSGNNLVDTQTYAVFTNATKPFDAQFTSVVVVTKVEIVLTITAGSDIDIVIPYAAVFIVIPTEIIVVPDQQVIRVEEVEYFYDPNFELEISNIRTITRKYDNDKIYNKVNIGYTTWKSEEIQGIDDVQTQHIYSTRFEKIGQTITLWSDFIAASLAIEGTRRKTIAESTDYKFDDSTFIIAVNPDDVSPDVYTPELDEEFSSIENLLDPELRYNTRLSPARNLLRWRNWLNGCLQNWLNTYYKFVRGEGNFDMISTMVGQSPECLNEAYDNQPLSEKQDIEVTNDFIHLPNYYEFETPLDWEDYKTIRNNRTKAIGISLTDENHVSLFIDQLEYSVMHGSAKITGWTNEFMELSVTEDQPAQQLCLPDTSCDNPITDEFEEALTDEFGVCITA
jgi:hypothetical protein